MTDRPKLEEIIDLPYDPAPLLVIDFNVMCFAVLNWYQQRIEGFYKPETHRKIIRGAWALFVNRGPQFLKKHPFRVAIVADYRDPDRDNYWRDEFMEKSEQVQKAWLDYAAEKNLNPDEIKKNYKGTRSKKTDQFWLVYNEGFSYCREFFPWFWRKGYEADDIAGSICRASRLSEKGSVLKERYIFLHTVDRDWCQLVDDENKILFSNTRFCKPNEFMQEQLNGEQGVIEWTKHKMRIDIGHPSELAYHKAKAGDMCDNAVKGSPIELFDLCEPNPVWNIDDLLWDDYFSSEMNNPEPNVKDDHYMQSLKAFVKINIEPPVAV